MHTDYLRFTLSDRICKIGPTVSKIQTRTYICVFPAFKVPHLSHWGVFLSFPHMNTPFFGGEAFENPLPPPTTKFSQSLRSSANRYFLKALDEFQPIFVEQLQRSTDEMVHNLFFLLIKLKCINHMLIHAWKTIQSGPAVEESWKAEDDFDCIMKAVPHSDGLHQPVFQLQQAAVFSDDKLTVRCLYAACLTMNS